MEAIAYICQNLKESYRCKQPHSYMFNGKTLLLATSKRFTVCKNIYSLHVLSSFPSTATKTYNHETLTDLKQAAFPCLPFNFSFFSLFFNKNVQKKTSTEVAKISWSYGQGCGSSSHPQKNRFYLKRTIASKVILLTMTAPPEVI